MASRQHLVGNDAERPDVPAGRDDVAGGLLRGHVIERADQQPGARAVAPWRDQLGTERLCEPEVEHLRDNPGLLILQEDVLGLQIAVHETLRMRGAHGRADAPQDVQDFADGQGTSGAKALPQRLAFEQLHDEKRATLAIEPEVVDADDVHVREAGGRPRLTAEAVGEIRRDDEVLTNQLYRNGALERFVHGRVDRPHSPAPQTAIEPVASVQPPGPAQGREPLLVVRAQITRAVETASAALALAQSGRGRLAWRPPDQQPQGMCDGDQQVDVFLVVGLLGAARTQRDQRCRDSSSLRR